MTRYITGSRYAVLVTTALAVMLWACQPVIRHFSRVFESHNLTPSALNLYAYRADIQARPVKGVDNNLSGLTWSGRHGLLFAVINNPSELIWLTREGERVGSVMLTGIEDAEAVEWVGESFFRIGSEKLGIAWLVNVNTETQRVSIVNRETLTFRATASARNRGLEGLAWDPDRQRLYAAREKKPVLISVSDRRNTGETHVFRSGFLGPVRDISGLHYHAQTSSLLVLSDESKKVVEISPEGRFRDSISLRAGQAGLAQDIPQAEGITLDDEGNLYIVSEPNLFYRFSARKT